MASADRGNLRVSHADRLAAARQVLSLHAMLLTGQLNTVRAEPVEALRLAFDKPVLSEAEGLRARGCV